MPVAETDNNPGFHKSKFICPLCRAYAGQEWSPIFVSNDNRQGMTLALLDPETEEQYYNQPPDDAHWNVARCIGCNELTFWRGCDLVYPKSGSESLAEPHPSLPAPAKGLLLEAIAVFPISRRASAALCRAALESLLREIVVPIPGVTLNLAGRVNSLHGKVSSDLWKLLTAIRHIGNKTLHGADESDLSVALYLDDDQDYIPKILIEAVNQLAEQLIETPDRIDKIYQSIPESVRSVAEREVQKYAKAEGKQETGEVS